LEERTAQKRVMRAIEKLRKFFAQRGVTLTATAIADAVSANSIQAVPAGLAAIISATTLSGTTITTAAVLAVTKAIAMTTLQKTLVTAALVATVGAGIFEAHQNSQLREQNQTLQQQHTSLSEQIAQLQSEQNNATNRVATLLVENDQPKSNSNEMELLKLRGEVGVLKSQLAQAANIANSHLTTQLTHQPGTFIAWTNFTLAGFNTPESALESGFYRVFAMNKNPQATNGFGFLGIKILARKDLAEDRAEVLYRHYREPKTLSENRVQPMIKIGDSWMNDSEKQLFLYDPSWEQSGNIVRFSTQSSD
jgi:cell division protein FtsL